MDIRDRLVSFLTITRTNSSLGGFKVFLLCHQSCILRLLTFEPFALASPALQLEGSTVFSPNPISLPGKPFETVSA